MTRLTQFLKIRFDLTFEHPNHAPNPPQGRQFTAFRPSSYRPLANAEYLLQFRQPNQPVAKLGFLLCFQLLLLPLPAFFLRVPFHAFLQAFAI